MTTAKRQAERAQRLAVANLIIEAIASCGRRFLSMNSDRPDPQPGARVSRFELLNGRLWYVDKYRESRIYVSYDPPWRSGWGWRFSEGGTLLSLLRNMRDYILKGTAVDLWRFGPFPQHLCGGDLWGYGANMAGLRDKIEAILKGAA
jgi:hypothetical protein